MASLELTKSNLDKTIQENEIVILDFWAPWCGPCRAFGPIFEKVSEKYPNIKFGKVNTDAEQEVAAAFEIRSIPTLAVFKDKDMVFYQPGMLPEDVFEDLIKKVEALDMNEVRKQVKENSN